MSDREKAQQERADWLRKQIEQLDDDDESLKIPLGPEMQPGESPKEYAERRRRELASKKPDEK